MYRTLGQIRRERSEFEAARRLLDRALQAHARAGASEADPDRVDSVLERVRVLNQLSDSAPAVGELRRLIPVLEQGGAASTPRLAEALRLLGGLLGGAESDALLRRSLALRRAQHPPDPVALASSLDALAESRHAVGAFDDARALWQEALPILERSRGADHVQTLLVLSNLATTIRDPREQAVLQRRLIESHERLLGPKSAMLANDWNNYGVSLARAKDYAGAAAALQRSFELRAEIQGQLHPATISTLRNVARVHEIRGAFGESLAAFDDVTARVARAKLPPERIAHFRVQRAQVLLRLGRVADAEAALERALRELRTAGGAVDAEIANARLVQGRAALAAGRPALAVERLRECVAIRERTYDPGDQRTAEAQAELGRALLAAGDGDGTALLRTALPLLRAWGQFHPDDLAAAEAALGERD
jgi:tetratricopeptide (TPR) repeat protein